MYLRQVTYTASDDDIDLILNSTRLGAALYAKKAILRIRPEGDKENVYAFITQ